MTTNGKRPTRIRPAPTELPTSEPTDEERRARWRREAGTAAWQDETGDRSGAPVPSSAWSEGLHSAQRTTPKKPGDAGAGFSVPSSSRATRSS